MISLALRARLRYWIPLAGEYSMSAAAFIWRRLMFRTTFIAVSGSVGKSTATRCLGSILSSYCPTNCDAGTQNHRVQLARIILRTRPWHRFTVIEVGTRAPGALRRAAWMIAPDVVLMLRVLNLHSNAFPTTTEMAAEKAQLMSRLSRRGMAVLNADDDLVRGMGSRSRARIRTFGLSADRDVMAADVDGRWPRPLSFRVRCAGGEWVRAETPLFGAHFVHAVLGAIATAVSCGVPLQQAVAALRDVKPIEGRMRAMELPCGATAISGPRNGALPTLDAGLDFLAQAEASRRIIVLADVLDTGLSVRPRLRELGRRVVAATDMCVFIGKEASVARKAAVEAGARPDCAFSFTSLEKTAEFCGPSCVPETWCLWSAGKGGTSNASCSRKPANSLAGRAAAQTHSMRTMFGAETGPVSPNSRDSMIERKIFDPADGFGSFPIRTPSRTPQSRNAITAGGCIWPAAPDPARASISSARRFPMPRRLRAAVGP